MTTKRHQKPRERVITAHLVYGHLLAAAPRLRELADATKAEIAEGLSEAEARQRIRSRLESLGLTALKQLLPSVSRKMLRVSLRKLLRALADLLADKSKSKTLGAALDSMLAKIGFDQWLEDYVWTYASTGEVAPIFTGYAGTVMCHEFGPKGDKTPTVWLIATPASDIEALIEWFRDEARQAFPDETFAKRHGKALDGARYHRMNQEGRSYSQIALDNIYELYPELCASDDEEEFAFYTQLVKRETERVKKLAERTAARGDRILGYVSPNETD
jgi:hypothetical protein